MTKPKGRILPPQSTLPNIDSMAAFLAVINEKAKAPEVYGVAVVIFHNDTRHNDADSYQFGLNRSDLEIASYVLGEFAKMEPLR